MDQWRPFVLALYYHTNPESERDAAQFYRVLETIEKLNLRRLLISERPSIFREVFIEAVEEFNLAPTVDATPDSVYETFESISSPRCVPLHRRCLATGSSIRSFRLSLGVLERLDCSSGRSPKITSTTVVVPSSGI